MSKRVQFRTSVENSRYLLIGGYNIGLAAAPGTIRVRLGCRGARRFATARQLREPGAGGGDYELSRSSALERHDGKLEPRRLSQKRKFEGLAKFTFET
jgi:hypothetical protein